MGRMWPATTFSVKHSGNFSGTMNSVPPTKSVYLFAKSGLKVVPEPN